jgi:hypothetical protein
MSYEGMSSGEGEAASIAYRVVLSGKLGKKKFNSTRENLLDYCKRDTLGMVVIVARLLKL